MEELKQWVTAFYKGGVQMSEDFAGLYHPPPPSVSPHQSVSSTVVGGNRSTVIGRSTTKSVAGNSAPGTSY